MGFAAFAADTTGHKTRWPVLPQWIKYTGAVPRPKPLAVLVGEYTSLAFLLPISTLVGYGIGYLLDKAFGTHWLYILFLILGTVSGFVQIIRTLLRDVETGTRDDR